MNRYPGFHGQDAERMEVMGPEKAQYIIQALPKRLYVHPEWGVLEYATLQLPPDPTKGKRVLLGIGHSLKYDIAVATYVLYEDGSMYMYDTFLDKRLPHGIRFAHLHMLLCEGSVHGWKGDDSNARIRMARDMGMRLDTPHIAHQRELSRTMEKVRNAYGEIVA